MSEYNDVENILKKLAKENPKEMDDIDGIDESVFAKIEDNVLLRTTKIGKQKAKKLSIYLKAAAAAIAIFAAFSVTMYLVDIPSSRAKDAPDAASGYESEGPDDDSRDDVYTLNMPKYIPEGYSLVSVKFDEKTNAYFAEYKYTAAADESLYILIIIEGDEIILPDDVEKSIEELEYNGLPFILTTLSGEPVTNYANFTDKNGYQVQIVATVYKEELLKIMEGME